MKKCSKVSTINGGHYPHPPDQGRWGSPDAHRDATFCQVDKRSNGFLIAHVDTHKNRSVLDYITVSDFAVIGGLRYWRTDDEIVTPY